MGTGEDQAGNRYGRRSIPAVCAACLLAGLLLGNGWPAYGGLFDVWPYRMRIAFSGYNRPQTLTNFPVLVMLDETIPEFAYRRVASPVGADLRFSDSNDVEELSYEIERWNTNGSSYVWVRVPALAGTNHYIWAHYGRVGAPVPPCATNGSTWTGAYAAVWHLNDGGTGPRLDATTNRCHGSPSGYEGDEAFTTGRVAGADLFDGGNDQIDCGSNVGNFALADRFTVEAWAAGSLDSADRGIYGNTWASPGYLLRINTANRARFILVENGSTYNYVDSSILAVGWHHFAGVWDGSLPRVYVDGADDSQLRGDTGPTTITTTEHTWIGSVPGMSAYFKGPTDEVRVSRLARSSNWIWACWMNVASNRSFASYQVVSKWRGACLQLQ